MRKAGQVLSIFAIGLGIGLIVSESSAKASSTSTTPRSIRGTWYAP